MVMLMDGSQKMYPQDLEAMDGMSLKMLMVMITKASGVL